ncbi:hypothetical protein PHYSODRAFT_516479 [Phytophthora sojae]|uniref:Uncharacterized protein n=1 Tax=Phytophthora sojae (strain P6497) TaxID=1094619 RepID=G4ZVT8_PHYSP|nr:hypothetical protein PHYSODRAFT_516479 [Phytophthora sojae]EGZ12274.1 hypothetical protein PHYSODRAFT_516479 [Phytophthora sojae]|eukprot:XP_009532607.1 hypothetical protein PHYSODRAFT_516479 [Phytophthora sojae]
MSLYRVLHTKHAVKQLKGICSGAEREEEEEQREDDAEVTRIEGILEDEAHDNGSEKEPTGHLPPGKASSKGIWDLLVPAVEKIQQKASRKCQDLSAAIVVEEEDDDDEDEEEEQADEVDDEDETRKKSRKRRASELKSARLKPLVEPDGVDFFDRKRLGAKKLHVSDWMHRVLAMIPQRLQGHLLLMVYAVLWSSSNSVLQRNSYWGFYNSTNRVTFSLLETQQPVGFNSLRLSSSTAPKQRATQYWATRTLKT